MGRTIKLSISARGVETDAPTVDDLLDQVRDYFDILVGVEEAVSEDGTNVIDWRIIGASKESPLALEVAPFARAYATNVDKRVELVAGYTARGLDALRSRSERPQYFTDRVLARAERLFERVTNGLNLTTVDYGPGFPVLALTPAVARAAVANAKSALSPISRPYKEIGSVEGFFRSAERDGYGRPLLWIHQRLTGEDIKCVVTGDALKEVQTHEIKEVWLNRRIQVIGTIHYKALGRINQIDAVQVRFLRRRNELPDVEDILDAEFTGGLRSEEYLERVRNGELS